MARIAAYEDVKANRKQREVKGGYAWRTEFLVPPGGDKSEPQAFLAERCFNGGIRPHFHDVDQFQVVVSGSGAIGRHRLAIHSVHFARAYTPYGPIVPDEPGLGFLTLRPRHAAGQFIVPDRIEMLKNIPNRSPWQITELPKFDASSDVSVQTFSKIRDEHGLAAFSLHLKPHARTSAPDPATSNGQYLIITQGSLVHLGNEHKAVTIVFVRPDEHAFQLAAGAQGLEALVLNFPRQPAAAQMTSKPEAAGNTEFRVWQCMLCAFTYDEAKGMPDEGVAAGTRWEDVPESWTCPDCAATKSDFEMAVIG
jgi:rubredoxin